MNCGLEGLGIMLSLEQQPLSETPHASCVDTYGNLQGESDNMCETIIQVQLPSLCMMRVFKVAMETSFLVPDSKQEFTSQVTVAIDNYHQNHTAAIVVGICLQLDNLISSKWLDRAFPHKHVIKYNLWTSVPEVVLRPPKECRYQISSER